MIQPSSRVSNLDGTSLGTVERVYPDGQGGIAYAMVRWDESHGLGRVEAGQLLEVAPEAGMPDMETLREEVGYHGTIVSLTVLGRVR